MLPPNLFQQVEIKWLHPENFSLSKYDDNSYRGCILEVDLEFPKKLHELHNDHLLVPDKLENMR